MMSGSEVSKISRNPSRYDKRAEANRARAVQGVIARITEERDAARDEASHHKGVAEARAIRIEQLERLVAEYRARLKYPRTETEYKR